MQAIFIVLFVALCVSAPRISRKWGARGEWAWGIATMAFLVAAIFILGNP